MPIKVKIKGLSEGQTGGIRGMMMHALGEGVTFVHEPDCDGCGITVYFPTFLTQEQTERLYARIFSRLKIKGALLRIVGY